MTNHLTAALLSRFLRASALVAVLLLPSAGLAQDQPAKKPYFGLAGTSSRTSIDGKTTGFAHAHVLFENEQPTVCFSAKKDADGKPRYLCLLLIKPAEKPVDGQGVSGKIDVMPERAEYEAEIDLGESTFTLTQLEVTDPATKEGTESFLINGKELKPDDSRVFLVELSKEQAKLTPLKVDLPQSVPDVANGDEGEWIAALQKAVAELKMKSPEVARELGGGK
jgi:hypothetical protein